MEMRFGAVSNLYQFRKCKFVACLLLMCTLFTSCNKNTELENCENFIGLMLNIPQNAFVQAANAERDIISKQGTEAGTFVTDNTVFLNAVKEVFKDCVSEDALKNVGNSVYSMAIQHEMAAIKGWSYELKDVSFEKDNDNVYSFKAQVTCHIPQGEKCMLENDSTADEIVITGIVQTDKNGMVNFIKINR